MRVSRNLLLLLVTLTCALPVWAADPVTREDQFKAAYLFNFLKFVEWPATVSNEELSICFIGADGVHDTLAAGIESKRAGSRRLTVRRLQSRTSFEGCNVLFAGADVATGVHLGAARQLPMLTVSDTQDFAEHAGIIQLFNDNNRLRFDINIDNAQKAGLRISSGLLQLAAQVRREGK